MRRMFGAVVLCFGLMTAAYSWTAAERDPERPPLMNLGARAEVMRPVCACEGRPLKVGSCLRAGYLGVSCKQWGFELGLPLWIPLVGGLALAWLGASMTRRKKPSESNRLHSRMIRPAARMPTKIPRAKKTMRKMFGGVVLCFGLLAAAYSWTAAERDPERPPLMNLGARTEVMRPVCACEGRPLKVGSCLRAGYLGVSCKQWGFELALPLGIPLIGGLALAGLGASMMRRKDPSEFAWLPPA